MELSNLAILSEFAFPCLVSFYLLTKTTKTIEENTKAIQELKQLFENFSVRG